MLIPAQQPCELRQRGSGTHQEDMNRPQQAPRETLKPEPDVGEHAKWRASPHLGSRSLADRSSLDVPLADAVAKGLVTDWLWEGPLRSLSRSGTLQCGGSCAPEPAALPRIAHVVAPISARYDARTPQLEPVERAQYSLSASPVGVGLRERLPAALRHCRQSGTPAGVGLGRQLQDASLSHPTTYG